MSDVPECLRCGACCFSNLETYIRVDGDSYARLGDATEHVTTFVGNRCYMRMEDGHCAALRVEAGGLYVCSVYEQRPEVCRQLGRGSSECAAERLLKSERPLQARLSLLADSHSV